MVLNNVHFKVALNQLLHCFVSTGVITVEDFLFTKDKHNSSDYPDDNTVDEVSPLFSIDLVLNYPPIKGEELLS